MLLTLTRTYSSKEAKEGLPVLVEFRKYCPDNESEHFCASWRSYFYRELGQLEASAKAVNGMKLDNPERASETFMRLGEIEAALSRYSKALEYFARSIECANNCQCTALLMNLELLKAESYIGLDRRTQALDCVAEYRRLWLSQKRSTDRIAQLLLHKIMQEQDIEKMRPLLTAARMQNCRARYLKSVTDQYDSFWKNYQ